MADLPQIYLTQNDVDRLLKLVESQPGKRFQKLESELVRAKVVPREKIHEDVVTMNSRVIFDSEITRERRCWGCASVSPSTGSYSAAKSRVSALLAFRSSRKLPPSRVSSLSRYDAMARRGRRIPTG